MYPGFSLECSAKGRTASRSSAGVVLSSERWSSHVLDGGLLFPKGVHVLEKYTRQDRSLPGENTPYWPESQARCCIRDQTLRHP